MKSIKRRSKNVYWIWHTEGNPLYYHREDGPAIEFDDGRTGWWLFDKPIKSAEEFRKRLGLTKEDVSIIILKHGPITMDEWM